MRSLALDVGDERIGVAISDLSGFLARPLEVVRRVAGPASFHRIAALIEEHQVSQIVVGLPLLPDGSEGKQVQSTRAYVRGLEQHVAVPILWWDERDSTRRAQRRMINNGRSRKRRRSRIDAVAAAVILQEYLDQNPRGLES